MKRLSSRKAVITISNIDFRQLRSQKSKLIEVLCEMTNTRKALAIEGILSLIDTIQDYAVDSEQLTSEQVFGFRDK